MGYENTSGLNVFAQYGARRTGGTVGNVDDAIQEMSVYFTDQSLTDGFMPPFLLPQGARVLRYVLRVDEAFTMTGTTPTVIFGGTAPATNGVVLTAAELAAVGTKIPASAGTGTWSTTSATGATAAERVTRALGGTTPAVTLGAGKATLVVEYLHKRRS